MKRVACYLTIVGLTLVGAAGLLRAATTEDLPEPDDAQVTESRSSEPSIQHRTTAQDNTTHFAVGNEQEYLDHDPDEIGPPAYPYSSGNWWRNGCWYADVDFVVWNRSQPFSRVLGVDATPVGVIFRNTLNKHGTQLPVEPGGRGTLGYVFDRDFDNRDHSIEVTYLGFNNWDGVDSLKSQNGQTLRVPESPAFPGFNLADTYTTTYRSSLQSFEVDYRIRNRPGRDRMIMGPDGFWSRQFTPGCTQSLLVGFRGISEQENFHWIAERNNISPSDFGGDFLVNTKNWLFGVQVGGDFMNVHDHWYWGLKGDTGIYCNFSDGFERIHGIDPNATTPEEFLQSHATNQTAGYLGELSFMVGYNLSDHMMVHAGWDLALLGGLAIAPDQVSFATYLADKSPFVNTGGVIFYNGLSLGLEGYW